MNMRMRDENTLMNDSIYLLLKSHSVSTRSYVTYCYELFRIMGEEIEMKIQLNIYRLPSSNITE